MRNLSPTEAIKSAVDLLEESHGNLSELLRKGDFLKPLMKELVERALQGELKEHLGYDKHERSDSSNARMVATQRTYRQNMAQWKLMFHETELVSLNRN